MNGKVISLKDVHACNDKKETVLFWQHIPYLNRSGSNKRKILKAPTFEGYL
jgi:hypothetical protein